MSYEKIIRNIKNNMKLFVSFDKSRIYKTNNFLNNVFSKKIFLVKQKKSINFRCFEHIEKFYHFNMLNIFSYRLFNYFVFDLNRLQVKYKVNAKNNIKM